jgi:uroporphyrinogen decarboxylase
VNVLSGEPVDRAPFLDYMGTCNWRSCLDRWKREGLAHDATFEDVRRIVGFDGVRGYRLPVKSFIWPEYPVESLGREGNVERRRNRWGGTEVHMEGSELMAVTVAGAVTDRKSWAEVERRLDVATPGRLPEDWEAICDEALASDEPVYAGDLPVGFFGGLRELVGFERLAYLFYDDPGMVSAMLDALCELWTGIYTRMQERVPLDYFFVWEDMCDKNGPLISPSLFRAFLLPRYQRLTEALREAGCRLFAVDSDGDERPLVPLWAAGGIDVVLPWETQFGLDIREVRRRYPEIGIIGGINKHALAGGREAIDEELAKVPYMLAHGRYIPSLDHGVTNEVSWDDYRYFYDRLRELIGEYG